jgi:hypothetical protein
VSDIEELEKYFDVLLENAQGAPSETPLVKDEERFALYQEVKGLFSKVSVNMDCMSELVAKLYPPYVEILHELAINFGEMAHIENEDMDSYLRTLAVDRLVYNAQGLLGKNTQEQLGYLVQGLMVLFFEEGEGVLQTLSDILDELKDKKTGFFKKKQDAQVQDYILHTMELYEEIESDLTMAKQGIIARDKKMIEVLKQLKLRLGGCVIKAAVQQMKTDNKAPLQGKRQKKWQQLTKPGKGREV